MVFAQLFSGLDSNHSLSFSTERFEIDDNGNRGNNHIAGEVTFTLGTSLNPHNESSDKPTYIHEIYKFHDATEHEVRYVYPRNYHGNESASLHLHTIQVLTVPGDPIKDIHVGYWCQVPYCADHERNAKAQLEGSPNCILLDLAKHDHSETVRAKSSTETKTFTIQRDTTTKGRIVPVVDVIDLKSKERRSGRWVALASWVPHHGKKVLLGR